MNYEIFIGKRYLLSRRSDQSVSIITWISIGGVALGVIALIVSTAIMNGFSDNLRNAIIGSLPHVNVYGLQSGMPVTDEILQKIKNHPEVKAYSPYIFRQGLLTGGEKPNGALIRGIDPAREPKVTEMERYIRDSVYPGLPPDKETQQTIARNVLARLAIDSPESAGKTAGVILGAALALNMNVTVGDTVRLVSSEQRMTPMGDLPRFKNFEVIGIFESGIAGYDDVLAFVDLRLVQRIFNMGHHVSGIGIAIEDAEDAPQVAKELEPLVEPYFVRNWADDNKSIFQVMKLEKYALFLILTLIVVVAAFNIISSLIMMVIEKNREIAILKSIGATDGSIRKIFMFQGVIVGTVGTICGVLSGLGICYFLMNFNILDIPPGVYPGGNRIPVAIHWNEVILTAVCSFLICFLVTLYPSSRAARLKPAEALRFE